MDGLSADFAWHERLRTQRLQRGLSQPEVARRSGLSVAAVKAYERGARHPSRKALDAVLNAIGLSHDETNPIVAGAGFAIDWRGVFERRYIADLDELKRQADESPWPVFITNQGSYVVHWNRPFEVVWDVDVRRDFPDPMTRNLLSGASIARFTQCIASYDETMSFFLGLIKSDPRQPGDFERPAPWHLEAVERLFAGDPAELRRLWDAWERAEPLPHKIRHQYRVIWRYRGVGPELRFIGQLTVCDIWNELNWQEWIPADGETWAALASLSRGPHP